jgi:hypothetical protein
MTKPHNIALNQTVQQRCCWTPPASRRGGWLTRTLNVCFLEFLRSVSAILSFRFGSAAPKQPQTEMFVIGDRHRQGSVRCGHSALHSIAAIDTQASAYEEYGFSPSVAVGGVGNGCTAPGRAPALAGVDQPATVA